ncbi:MAG: selenium cofactor biosynthesis protein YqeC [Anaerolineales bacterium]|jgi:molybdenum cofactor cytidylyltransferase
MHLSKALRIESGQVIAFVGAGGKTSAIRRLVSELSGTAPVLVTTSTKLALEEENLTEEHQIVEDAGGLITILSEWNHSKSLLLTGPELPDEPKWDGLPLAQLQDVIEFSREKKVILLIEADGAAGRSIKAPAPHEPALPHNLDLLVPVVAIDALGENLDSDFVHRPDEILKLLDLENETKLSVEHVAGLLKHPQGGLKALPLHAVLRVLINKVETDEQFSQANEIANLSLQEPKIESVVIGAVQGKDPVRATRGRVAAVVLAAGESKRFGGNKLLQVWQGKPLLQHVLEAVRMSKVDVKVLVLGYEQQTILDSVEYDGFEVVHNEEWAAGQSRSVKIGLEAVEDKVEAVIYPLGDMPSVQPDLINKLIDRYNQTLAPIVAPRVGQEWGNPVLFDRSTFPAFSEISGDRGAKVLFSRFEIESFETGPEASWDVDHPDDLAEENA